MCSSDLTVDGIHIHRISVGESQNFLQWISRMNEAIGRYGGDLMAVQSMLGAPTFDVIHAHDWLVGDAAIALKNRFKVPLIATIHATEYGRNNGIHNDLQRYVNHKETALIYESWRIIVCTNYMKRELQTAFRTPPDKLDVIFNGIRSEERRVGKEC